MRYKLQLFVVLSANANNTEIAVVRGVCSMYVFRCSMLGKALFNDLQAELQ